MKNTILRNFVFFAIFVMASAFLSTAQDLPEKEMDVIFEVSWEGSLEILKREAPAKPTPSVPPAEGPVTVSSRDTLVLKLSNADSLAAIEEMPALSGGVAGIFVAKGANKTPEDNKVMQEQLSKIRTFCTRLGLKVGEARFHTAGLRSGEIPLDRATMEKFLPPPSATKAPE